MYLAYKKIDYPYNLIYDVFNDKNYDGDQIVEEVRNNVPNILEAVNYVLDKICTVKENLKQIVEYRYRDKMTYNEIAAIFGLSGERIRQKLIKAVHRLRYPILKHQLRYGLNANIVYNDVIEFSTFSARTYRCLIRSNINNMYDLSKVSYNKLSSIQNLGIKSMNEIISKLDKCFYDTTHLKIGMKNIKVKDVDFSTRTRNCLRHAKIYSMNKLYDLSYRQMLALPKVGVRVATEMIEMLNKCGYDISHIYTD